MSLGVCCQWLEPRTKRDGSVVYENSINERTLQLGRFQKGLYSKSYIREVYINNIKTMHLVWLCILGSLLELRLCSIYPTPRRDWRMVVLRIDASTVIIFTIFQIVSVMVL